MQKLRHRKNMNKVIEADFFPRESSLEFSGSIARSMAERDAS
jgi:hypothetical protein